MSRSYKLYLADIVEAAERTLSYLRGLTRDQFESDQMRVDAVAYNLQIIGEAAKGIPEAIRIKYPDVEWKRMSGSVIVSFMSILT